MAAKKSMKFHRMSLLKGRFINSYILFTALRKVVSKEYMKAGKDVMTATTEEHLGEMQTVRAKPARTMKKSFPVLSFSRACEWGKRRFCGAMLQNRPISYMRIFRSSIVHPEGSFAGKKNIRVRVVCACQRNHARRFPAKLQ